MSGNRPYEVKIAQGKLDYQLISVHFQRGYKNGPIFPATEETRKLLDVVKSANKLFGHKTLELSFPTMRPSFEKQATVFISTIGEIIPDALETIRTRNIVLIGQVFGVCHANAYNDLRMHGISEIHMPADLISGMPGDPITALEREVNKQQRFSYFPKYGYDDDRVRFAAVENGQVVMTQESRKRAKTSAYLYRTWEELLKLLTGTRKKSPGALRSASPKPTLSAV